MVSRMLAVCVAIFLLTTLTACAGLESEQGATEDERRKLARANNRFAVTFYSQVAEDAEQKNLFFSPFSIASALAMTCEGARGETARQMADVLELDMQRDKLRRSFRSLNSELNPEKDEAAYQLTTANALWGQEGYEFRDAFVELTRRYYGAGLRRVDYRTGAGREEAREVINSWVSEETQGKIDTLIARGALSHLTRLVLTNAIYFKGLWAAPFDKKRTQQAPFTTASGEKVDADLMYQKGTFRYRETDEGVQLLEMPYKGEELSMLVLLPPEPGRLGDLEEKLSPDELSEWLKGSRERKVRVYLPRFEMRWKADLVPALKALGMPDAFSLPPADFSGMTGEKDLFISNVVHEAYVKVDEEGTEAAAATGVVVGVTSVQPQPPEFRADHPFMFCIRHRDSGAILFVGRVTDPTAGGA